MGGRTTRGHGVPRNGLRTHVRRQSEFGAVPEQWPTPTVMNRDRFDPVQRQQWAARFHNNGYGLNLGQAVQARSAQPSWPTPTAQDSEQSGAGKKRGDSLTARARKWPTPRATTSEARTYARTPSQQAGRRGLYLQAEANELERDQGEAPRTWPTPRASEWKGTGPLGSKSHEHRVARSYLDATVQDAEQASGPLNPAWVEWLMGMPLGWTDPELENDQLQPHPSWASDPADDGRMPRLQRGVKQLKHRLKALGNAVVPAQAAWAAAELRARLEGTLE